MKERSGEVEPASLACGDRVAAGPEPGFISWARHPSEREPANLTPVTGRLRRLRPVAEHRLTAEGGKLEAV